MTQQPTLLVLDGASVGRTYPIPLGESSIGRSSRAAIQLDDQGISRLHAAVHRAPGLVRLRDLDSANGTFLNGARIREGTLKEGDKVGLGTQTLLRFAVQDEIDQEYTSRLYAAALRDPTTKAFNRRYLQERVEAELAYTLRHRTALALLLLDIDHFKRVNDTFGHLAGDSVLAALAELVQATLRTEDLFARYGREEFAILARGLDRMAAGQLAERLRAAVARTPFQYLGRAIPVTVSIGATSTPEARAGSFTELLTFADAALYEAKNGGRNRVRVRID